MSVERYEIHGINLIVSHRPLDGPWVKFSDYEVVEAEAKALEERAVGAEVLANDYCEAKEQASVDLREFGGHKVGCSNYRASRDCDCGFQAALRRNP